jgi:hypothetical protein
MLGVGIAFGFLIYEAFQWTNALWGESDGRSLILMLPTRAIWAILAVFAPLCLTWEIVLRLWRNWGRPLQAIKYEAWSNSKAGFDATRVLQLMGITMVLPAAIAIALALPIHTSFGADRISIGHYGSVSPKRYSYSDIVNITVTKGILLRDGSMQSRPAITLDFANGDRWSSADNRDPDKSVDRSLLDILSAKTHLPVIYLDAFPFGSA